MADPMVKPAVYSRNGARDQTKEAQAPSASKIVIQPIVHDEEPTPEDPVQKKKQRKPLLKRFMNQKRPPP